MKLKSTPEDFRVEELTDVKLGDGLPGRFTFYRLTKRGIGTIEAADAICRRWNLASRQLSFGGLKDRHAVTIQYLTILDGPQKTVREKSFDLEPLGRVPHQYGPAHFRGNRFQIVLRDLSQKSALQAQTELSTIPRDGVPNYFDDQRFGSVGF
jgi:tRNA pseudouridine13 synthase